MTGLGSLDATAELLRELATAVDAQRLVAITNSLETPWVSPAADRARDHWAQADGAARTGADELRALSDRLVTLAADSGEAPLMTWPVQRPYGDPGATAPDGVVIVMPEWTDALASVWQAVATTILDELLKVSTAAAALPLDASTLALFQRVLGPQGNTALAAEHYRLAAEIATAEATGQL